MKPGRVWITASIFAAALSWTQLQGAVHQSAVAEMNEPAASVRLSPTGVRFESVVPYTSFIISFAGPDGIVHRRTFVPGESPYLEIPADARDGTYRYELRIAPSRVQVQGKAGSRPEPPSSPSVLVQNGCFLVAQGSVVGEGETDEPVALDVVNDDDLIVRGSLAVGDDVLENEPFGFSTIMLKENNTRITFNDTTTTAGYAANDWQLTANSSQPAGLNYFAIEDLTGLGVPFLVEAGAPTNSLYVASTGRVGLRTSLPELDLHLKSGNTPAFRLEQDTSSGLVPRVWDIAGNHTGFSIRDASASTTPFSIGPAAPSHSLEIAQNGNVGIGLALPERMLHLRGSNAVFRMDRSTDTAAFIMHRMDANGTALKTFVVGTNASGVNQGEFIINDVGTAIGGLGNRRMTITNEGNVQFTGNVSALAFSQTSSLAFKTNVRTYENALETVNRLRGVRFDWRDTGKPAVGLIAEEVDQVLPEIVAREDGKATGVNYANLVAVLVEALKEEHRANQELRARLDKIENLLKQR